MYMRVCESGHGSAAGAVRCIARSRAPFKMPPHCSEKRRCVLGAQCQSPALQIIPGEVAGEKGPLEVLEVGGAAGQLKTDLFRPAIQKHHRTRILFAIEDVGNDHEKRFPYLRF